MTPETKLMLDQLDEFFIVHARGPASRELWAVLAALRGPDTSSKGGLKNRTTIPIRAAAFPRLREQAARAFERYCADIIATGPFTIEQADWVAPHFIEHAIGAAAVLGINAKGGADGPA